MGVIERNRVRAAFHRQSAVYDSCAEVQQRVVRRLLDLLQLEALIPRRLLDVGAGTGTLAGGLASLYPVAAVICLDLAYGMTVTARRNLAGDGRVMFVNADAERLSFADSSFDLVVSTSTYQWLPALDTAFAEAYRVLTPGGHFRFALFGEQTLYELKSSYRKALTRVGSGREDRTHNFFGAEQVMTALAGAGFKGCQVKAELEQESHPDVPALLRSLKRIGAGNAAPAPSRGLAGRRVMLEMMDIYRREFGREGAIPATYEVVYGVGRKT